MILRSKEVTAIFINTKAVDIFTMSTAFVYDAYNLPVGQRKCEIKGGTFVFF